MGLFGNHARVGASAAGDYEIEKSLRFNSGDSTNLTRTSSAASSTWTYSVWIKRSSLSADTTYQYIFSSGDAGFAFHTTGDTFYIYSSAGGTLVQSTAYFRDILSWYHVVVQMNSGTANAWINNVQTHTSAGGFSLSTGTDETRIGVYSGGNFYFNGYQAEIHLVDGQALTPTSFAETNIKTGQWVPKKYVGSYGTDGFYLKFADNSGTTATTLGKDSSGNGNNFTPNNFSVTAGVGNDSLEDTPTNNYATLNVLAPNHVTITNGNLDWNTGTAQDCASTFGFTSGKWYAELTCAGDGQGSMVGIKNNVNERMNGGDANTICTVTSTGTQYSESSTAAVTTGGTWTTNDIIGIALDATSKTCDIYKNGSKIWGFTSFTVDGPYYFVFDRVTAAGSSFTHSVNFGQRAFSHQVSTYKALCTANLTEPTILKGTDYFNTVLYTGNGAVKTVTGVGFQPNLLINKRRDAANVNLVVDSVRGVSNGMSTALTSGDYTSRVASFNSDGFVSDNGSWGQINTDGATYAAWNWKESASAGFDIVSYTGNGSGPRTISHSLGVKPEMIIIKNREQVTNWMTYHEAIGAEKFLYLNTTASPMDDAAAWNDTEPTSSVFTVNADQQNNGDGDDIIAYLFASVEGYSKVGSYIGNGSADGPIVFTEFRPAFVLIKGGGHWLLYHNKVEGYNVTKTAFLANADNAEEALDGWSLDFYSNGFKMRGTDANANQDGVKFVYIAFGEVPFKYANAR